MKPKRKSSVDTEQWEKDVNLLWKQGWKEVGIFARYDQYGGLASDGTDCYIEFNNGLSVPDWISDKNTKSELIRKGMRSNIKHPFIINGNHYSYMFIHNDWIVQDACSGGAIFRKKRGM